MHALGDVRGALMASSTPGSHLWWKENSESRRDRRDWYRKESEVLEEYLVAITRRAEYLRSMDTWHQG